MRVLVGGAGGFVGSALVASLRAKGHVVVRLRRDRAATVDAATGDAGAGEPATGDAGAGDAVGWEPDRDRIDAAALEGLDAVVHLGGAGIGDRRWNDRRKHEILDSRTRGTSLLARAVASLENKPEVLVSASAIGYYGDRGEELLTERSEPGDDFLARVCREWEAAARPAADAGVRTVTLRSGMVLAGHGGALKRMLLPFRLGLGGRTGTGRQYMSWISLPDEVGAIEHALTDGAVAGPVNAVSPSPVTNAVFTSTLARVLRRPSVLPTPLLALYARYGRELVQGLLLASQRVEPEQLRATGYRFLHPTLEGALRAVLDRPA